MNYTQNEKIGQVTDTTMVGLYIRFDAASGLAVLEKASLPKDIIALGISGIRKI